MDDDASEEQIFEQDLDTLHASVVANISKSITSLKIQWEQLPNSKVEQCKDTTLNRFTIDLRPIYFDALIL
ncbi:hypothetical protein V8C37DRAFT_396749 [Trichoderma ceciliae]